MNTSLPSKVTLVEVSPRDGLQNEKVFLPTNVKLELIHNLNATGLPVIEATSFVSSKKIPQLNDADELYPGIQQLPKVMYPALVPNLEGLQRAIKANAKTIAVFISSSNTFSQKNINCSAQQGLKQALGVIEQAQEHKIKVRAYISCVLGCPYEGETDIKMTATFAKALLDAGCYEISLGDTIGIGTVRKMQNLLRALFKKGIQAHQLAVHCHDTYGQALVNIYAALEYGVNTVDASVAGLGGCPYAKGATGNVATEDVLYMLNGLGIETGVDLQKLIAVGDFISKQLNRPNLSKVASASRRD